MRKVAISYFLCKDEHQGRSYACLPLVFDVPRANMRVETVTTESFGINLWAKRLDLFHSWKLLQRLPRSTSTSTWSDLDLTENISNTAAFNELCVEDIPLWEKPPSLQHRSWIQAYVGRIRYTAQSEQKLRAMWNVLWCRTLDNPDPDNPEILKLSRGATRQL